MSSKPPASKKPSALGNALAATLASEARSVEDRFAKADKLFGGDGSATTPAAAPVQEAAMASSKPAEEGRVQPPREKVIRDSFSFPPQEHQQIDALLSDVLRQGIRSNKSEIVRAGLVALQNLSSEERHQIIQSLEKPKPGRPV
jgi:Arc/MetJ-type ribon-helix-helix transcriptional regulator